MENTIQQFSLKNATAVLCNSDNHIVLSYGLERDLNLNFLWFRDMKMSLSFSHEQIKIGVFWSIANLLGFTRSLLFGDEMTVNDFIVIFNLYSCCKKLSTDTNFQFINS